MASENAAAGSASIGKGRPPDEKSATLVIGIRGEMGAGKDTLAALIAKLHPEFRVWKFASALREAARILTDIPVERTTSDMDKAADLSGRTFAANDLYTRINVAIEATVGSYPMERGIGSKMFQILTGEEASLAQPAKKVTIKMTVGRLLQVLGTECFRDLVGADVWVDALFKRWEKNGYPSIVAADTRFPNESAAIRKHGGVVIHVRRKAAERADGRSTGHTSERALDGEKADIVLDNEGTIDDLHDALEAAWPAIVKLAAERAGPRKT